MKKQSIRSKTISTMSNKYIKFLQQETKKAVIVLYYLNGMLFINYKSANTEYGL